MDVFPGEVGRQARQLKVGKNKVEKKWLLN